MKEVRECPICDWKHEAERPQVPSGALASVFGAGVMSAVAMQQHAWDIERALDAHFRTHSTVDWVKATVALRARVAEFAQIAHDEAVAAQKLADRVAEAEALLGALRKPPCVDDPVEWVGVPNDWWGRYEAWTGPSAGGGHE